MYNNINVPVDHINIYLISCVSAGKSTVLNAIFCQDYTQTRIKRTIIVPSFYRKKLLTKTRYKNFIR